MKQKKIIITREFFWLILYRFLCQTVQGDKNIIVSYKENITGKGGKLHR